MKAMLKLAAGLLAFCITVIPCTALHSEPVQAAVSSVDSLEYAEIMVSSVNDVRAANGLSEVALLPELSDVAELRAEELAVTFAHYRPDGSTCFTAVKEAGIMYSLCAENIAGGRADPISTITQWMDSEGHRANILNEGFTHIGLGYYYDPDAPYQHLWCMLLITAKDGDAPRVFPTQYIPLREKGDVNGSQSINASDSAAILQYAASRAAGVEYPVVSQFKKAADVNEDGVINSVDASIILQYAAARGTDPSVELSAFIWK